MNHEDCRYDWKRVGTLAGECLKYSPGNKTFPRDAELRLSMIGNDSDCTVGWSGSPDIHGYTVYFQFHLSAELIKEGRKTENLDYFLDENLTNYILPCFYP